LRECSRIARTDSPPPTATAALLADLAQCRVARALAQTEAFGDGERESEIGGRPDIGPAGRDRCGEAARAGHSLPAEAATLRAERKEPF
jgi:hypothetical protein